MKKDSGIYALILVIEIACIGIVIWLSLPYLKVISSGLGLGGKQTAEMETEMSPKSEPSKVDKELEATEESKANVESEADEESEATEESETTEESEMTEISESEKANDGESGLADQSEMAEHDTEQEHAGWISYTGAGSVDQIVLTEEGQRVYEQMKTRPDLYPEYLLEQVESYPEIIDFVYHYPEREQYAGKLTDEEIYASAMPLFLQWDKRWGYASLGKTCIATAGCGPTCLSMICTYLMQSDAYSPEIVAGYAEENRYYVLGEGSSWSLFDDGVPKLGLSSRRTGKKQETIASHLQKGLPAVVSLSAGDFTRGGHYIVLCGMDGDDTVRVYDPNSRIRSSHSWKLGDILEQARNIWLISLP